MNIQVFYNENGKTFEEIISDFLLQSYDLDNCDLLLKYT